MGRILAPQVEASDLLIGQQRIEALIVESNQKVVLANRNSPVQGVLSGPTAAIEKIENSVNSFLYDILLLDIQLAQATESPAKTGEDIGIIARKIIPKTKIVFMSSFSDNYRINSILKTVDPEGYMVKTEIDQKSLQAMVQTV